MPFGEVGTVENLTRDYSYAVIDAGVGYGEDTDRVSDVLREVAAGMESDGDWRDRVIPPFEVFGVQELGDSAVIVRCRFKTPPMQQWAVRAGVPAPDEEALRRARDRNPVPAPDRLFRRRQGAGVHPGKLIAEECHDLRRVPLRRAF